MRFDWRPIHAPSDHFLDQWRDLGVDSTTPNVYLMPEFLLPAVRHLETGTQPRLATVWTDDQSQLLAMAPFRTVPRQRKFPFLRLAAFRSIHSFQSGLLVRKGYEEQALDCLFGVLTEGPWKSIQFDEMRADTAAFEHLARAASRHGYKWFEHARYPRAAVRAGAGSRWREGVSRSRHKKLTKARDRLQAMGPVETRVLVDDEITDATIENFLHLESLGWKSNSSLAGKTSHETFFREMTAACRASGMLWFCELRLNDEVIASTSNFHVDNAGFAFKVGMNPAYAKFSPGYLVEYGFLEAAERRGLPFTEVESGAQAGSYIESLWSDRIPMVGGQFVAPGIATAMFNVRQRLSSPKSDASGV